MLEHHEQVILLDEHFHQSGTMDKAVVHTSQTPLHLAFSCYVFNREGQLLITRRALSKTAWPGVWSNSFCGHPQPGESQSDAIMRRAAFELGLSISPPELVVPRFQYCVTDASGVMENEFCPIYVAHSDAQPQPNPLEVMEYAWVAIGQVIDAISAVPQVFSPWMALQLQQPELLKKIGALA
ncbi:isopentenyl-diphosphate Delta-isomerase [Serratia rubidaea]|uniref:isopentenyl-diphosphate Delta-isomerase n=1 Tax=Serratia rubidaea TaxID=61652 RepID=UPI0023AF54F4|nr:isopentenyl-diphosphate Delta-isomerase [Serratia rubidaea]MDK1704413.1 isopentenyl-diphosphate Delta-isomerase [Serratia rubidaea]